MRSIPTLLLLAVAALAALRAAEAEFPLRAKFPQVDPIATTELAAAKPVLVDSRSNLEYGILHIVDAVLLPVDIMTADDLAKLRAKDDASRPLVFYCNGHTCRKSYEAVVKAAAWGFANVKCYDAGVFAWAEAHPERTRHFGEVLPADQLKASLISKEDFQARCLPPAAFIAAAAQPGVLVIDGRDAKDVEAFPIRLAGIENFPFDQLGPMLEAKSRKFAKRKLLILDNIGQQVKWLQYLLRRHGYGDYAFLAKGVNDGWRKEGFGNDGLKP
jgi:rhodanese-related sulfurtransferase